jgi:hypothetical protein
MFHFGVCLPIIGSVSAVRRAFVEAVLQRNRAA